ncbi:MAG: aldo/keto reductase [Myxococcota bacterium]
MHRRKLGHTDIQLSEIGLGTWGLSGAYGHLEEKIARTTIETALEEGVTTIDLSPLWGEGEIEEWVGDAIKERKREEVELIVRSGAVWDGDSVKHRFDPESLRRDLEGSLERLGTDHADVWLLHEPGAGALDLPDGDDAKEDEEDLYTFCQSLVDEGLIKVWGVSTSHVGNVRTVLSHGAKAICLPYNILHSDDLQDLEAELALAGAGVLARSPLFHGLLAGRWTQYRQFADDDHRRARWTQQALAIRVRQLNQLRYLVHDDVSNLATAAVRYVLLSSVVSSCLLGARRPIQIRNATGMAGEPPYLPDDDVERLGHVLSDAGA